MPGDAHQPSSTQAIVQGETSERAAKRRRLDTREPKSSGGPDGKRRQITRASRACEQCRAKKNRCTGEVPTCQTCHKAGITCIYDVQVRKRGLPTGYVHILESLWALVFQVVPQSLDTVLELLRQSHIGYDGDEKVILVNKHFATQSARALWRQYPLQKEIEKMISDLEGEEGCDAQEKRIASKLVAATAGARSASATTTLYESWRPVEHNQSECEPLRDSPAISESIDRPVEIVPVFPSHSIERDNTHRRDTFGYDKLGVPDDRHPAVEATPLGLPADAWTLVDSYFRFSGSWLPVIERHEAVRIVSFHQENQNADTSETALLWAIFAVATTMGSGDDSHTDAVQLETYSRVVESSLPTEIQSYTLRHVQGTLLLALLRLTKGQWPQAFILLGQAMRIVLLWLSPILSNLTAKNDTFAMVKLLLATFVLDTLAAARAETVPHLRSSDVEGYLCFDEQGVEEWGQWPSQSTGEGGPSTATYLQRPTRTLSTFKQYIKLICILNNALGGKGDQTLPGADADDLLRWKSHLPKHCQWDYLQHSSQQLHECSPSLANLWVTYEAIYAYIQGARQVIPQPMHGSSSSFPSTVLSGTDAYRVVFGASVWPGILQFHDWSRSRTKLNQPPSLVPNISNGNLGHTAIADRMEASAPGSWLPETQADRSIESDRQAERDARPAGIGSVNILGVNNGPNVVSTSFGDETSPDIYDTHSYHRNFDISTIESLVEELSATQDTDWNAMSSQFMYNLGFYDGDGRDV